MKYSSSLLDFLQIFGSVSVSSGVNSFVRGVNSFVHSDSSIVKIVRRWSRRMVLLLLVVGLVAYELRTSTLESWLLAYFSRRLSYQLGSGRSPAIAFPKNGPYDERLGYSRIPAFQSHLEAQGFDVTEQVRMSPTMGRLVRWGIDPPYREPAATGLEIRGSSGAVFYRATQTDRVFSNVTDI